MTTDTIAEAQARLRPLPLSPRTRADYRRVARWWELEARRGYPSAGDSMGYARNVRWAAETVGFVGPGTWQELQKRMARRG